jgi:hypothetical protein
MTCIYCGGPAQYGENGKLPICCKLHKTDWMVNVIKQCKVLGCCEIAVYGLKTKATHCINHKTGAMSDPNLCAEPKCDNRATHKLPRASTAYCCDHKKEGMLKGRQFCTEEKCTVLASFGISEATNCALHRSDLMTNRVKAMCKIKNCQSAPIFKGSGSTRINLCEFHKDEELENKCRRQGCDKLACFGNAIFSLLNFKAEFCQEHKPDYMLIVKPRAEKPNITRKRKL